MDSFAQDDLLRFFEGKPGAYAVYRALEEALQSRLPAVDVRVQKSQISLSNRRGFACVWHPARKLRGRPKQGILLTFGLPCRLNSPRIAAAVEPCPNRWTHHMAVETPAEIDDELLSWLQWAYDFTESK